MSSYALLSEGLVINTIVWDEPGNQGADDMSFGDGVTYAVIPEGCEAGIGWKFIEGSFTPPPLQDMTHEQYVADAEAMKLILLNEAANAIAPLQDAFDLGLATKEENLDLKSWKTYRVMLNRVDTSTAPDIDWPERT